jgi:hypothetical protein
MAGQEREWSAYDRQQPGLSINGPGSMWKPVRVFNKDAVPVPLTSDALSAAQAYAGRNQAGAVRIVRVMEDGEREVVETGGS